MPEDDSLLRLLWGTLTLRPYVFVFLAVYLVAAWRDLGPRRLILFTAISWTVAFLAEYSSTRNGFPFGAYVYTGETRGREFYLSNVPFFDSLSFTFLTYCGWATARHMLGRAGVLALWLGAFLMTLLDVVIDPVALRGKQWFLGDVYRYVGEGHYFGVPVSNFFGWFLVGFASLAIYLMLEGRLGRGRPEGRGLALGGPALYAGILGFNLAVTAWLGEWHLFACGALLAAAVTLSLRRLHRRMALREAGVG